MEPSPKRRRTEQGASNVDSQLASAWTREISPPPTKKRPGVHDADRDTGFLPLETSTTGKKSAIVVHDEDRMTSAIAMNANAPLISPPNEPTSLLPSPIHLTRVDGLSHANNIDCLSLSDLVGDPLIRECWAFNYLFDVNFLL